MKVNVEFDLSNEEDKLQHWHMMGARKYALALYDIDEKCRSQLKYHDRTDEHYDKLLEEIRQLAWRSGAMEEP